MSSSGALPAPGAPRDDGAGTDGLVEEVMRLRQEGRERRALVAGLRAERDRLRQQNATLEEEALR